MEKIVTDNKNADFTYEMLIKLLRSIGTIRIINEKAKNSENNFNSEYYSCRLKDEKEFVNKLWNNLCKNLQATVKQDLILETLTLLHNFDPTDSNVNPFILSIYQIFKKLNFNNFTLRSRSKPPESFTTQIPSSPSISEKSEKLAEKNLQKYFSVLKKRNEKNQTFEQIDLDQHAVADEREYEEWKIPESPEQNKAGYKITPRIEVMLAKYRESQGTLAKKQEDAKFCIPPECTFKPNIGKNGSLSKKNEKSPEQIKKSHKFVRSPPKKTEEILLEQCTFKPQLCPAIPNKDSIKNNKNLDHQLTKISNQNTEKTQKWPQRSKSNPKKSEIIVEVRISAEKTEKIILHKGDSPRKSALKFAKKHKMNADMTNVLIKLIQDKLINSV